MFENIIGHPQLVARLSAEVGAGTLPSSLLFYGPPYSGKCTTAIELARALTCEKGDGVWNCGCRSCEMHRYLIHPDTLILGHRSFLDEIQASGDALERSRRTPAQFLYVRAVRKLARRFDPVLWEGGDSKRGAVGNLISEIEEDLSALLPDRSLPDEKATGRLLKRIGERCVKVAEAVPDALPIFQIRSVAFWTHTAPLGRARVIIIESADRMLDSARNALLKILEEPPASTYFVLTTTRMSGIIPTILSRLRPYHFRERSDESVREVLAKIFREESGRFSDLKGYFLGFSEIDLPGLRAETSRFLAGVLEGAPIDRELVSALAASERFAPFLEELAEACRATLAAQAPGLPEPSIEQLSRFGRLIRECASRREQYNQNPSLLVEGLYYDMARAR